jgi:hypothetical protein
VVQAGLCNESRETVELSRAICDLLEQQRGLLRKGPLTNISGEEMDGYTQRNDRLRQLCKELEELN